MDLFYLVTVPFNFGTPPKKSLLFSPTTIHVAYKSSAYWNMKVVIKKEMKGGGVPPLD